MTSLLSVAAGVLLACSPLLRAQESTAVDPGLSQEIRKIVREELQRALGELRHSTVRENTRESSDSSQVTPEVRVERSSRSAASAAKVTHGGEGVFVLQGSGGDDDPVELRVEKLQDIDSGDDAEEPPQLRVWTTEPSPHSHVHVLRGGMGDSAHGRAPLRVEAMPTTVADGESAANVEALLQNVRMQLRELELRIHALGSHGLEDVKLQLDDVATKLKKVELELPKTDATTAQPKPMKIKVVRSSDASSPAVRPGSVEESTPESTTGTKTTACCAECCTRCCGDRECCNDMTKAGKALEAEIVVPQPKQELESKVVS